jgi:hypothetical protein
MSRMNLLTVTVALTAAFGVARSATAQTCTADKDCPQSFTCVDTGAVVNGTAPACPPNTACEPTSDLAPRKPQIVKSCQPKTCTTDPDCGAGMVCFEEKSTSCSGGSAVAPCPPGGDCPKIVPAEPNCVTTSRRLCAFKWQVPCTTDADCGDAFTCHPQEIISCTSSGSVGTPTPTDAGTSGGGSTGSTGSGNGGGASTDPATPGTKVAPPSDPICTEPKKTFPGYCQPKVTRCTADSECPTTWTCMQQATPVSTPPSPAPRPDTASDGGSASKSADPVPPDQGFAVPVRICTPPGGLGVRGSDSAGVKGDTTSTPMTPGNGTTAGGPKPVSMDPQAPPSAGGSGQPTTPSSGGCTIHDGSQPSRASGLALFTLLGLIAARRLRRR